MADAKAIAAAAKTEGNAAQAKGDFDAAIAAYTRAIAADPSDHVFFSNRSASYLSKGDAEGALRDAQRCVELNGAWGKGYGRLGSALFKLNRLEEARKAYKDGIAVERSAALAEGLEEVEGALAARAARAQRGAGGGGRGGGGLGALFGPEFLARVGANSKLAPYLQDAALMAKLMALSQDPTALVQAMGMGGMPPGMSIPGMPASPAAGDPRISELVQFAFAGMGRGGGGEGEEEGEEEEDEEGVMRDAPRSSGGGGGGSSSSSSSSSRPAPLEPKAAEPPPPPETPEERAARLEKEATRAKARGRKEEGNALYKARKFDEALLAYREAAALDPEDMTYLLNEASVHFEEKRWEECVGLCERALERGRELGAGYAVYAKCYLRMGNVAYAQGALARALDMYEKSSLEQRSDEVSAKVRKVKAEMKEAATRAYQDPALGAEAKERGNVAFKAGKWAEAIKEYSDAILRDPSNPAYYQNRATAQAKVMNYGGALEDCERALKLDAKFVKAMNRKGNCQVAMKEYHKAIETFKAALALEPTNQDTLDGLRLTQSKISEGSHGATDEERARRAMEDPEIQLLLRDPMVNAALEDLQKDQASASKVMRDPVMKAKIEKLIAAGVLRTG